MSTPEIEKHPSEHHHRTDGVFQVALENSVDCCDGGGSKVNSVYGTDTNAQKQQSQYGIDNEETVNEEGERVSAVSSLDGGTKRASAGRKQQQHWKSQSVGETVMAQQQQQQHPQLQLSHANSLSSTATMTTTTMTMTTTTMMLDDEPQQEAQTTTTNFSANRELWQRRATSQTQLNPSAVTSTPKFFRTSQEFREMRQKHTPDLVMDLPLSAQDASKKSASSSSLSSSDDETPTLLPATPARAEAATSPTGGPESPDMSTAAERFAKQNQCTLKKNTKTNAEGAGKLKRLETTEHDGNVDVENDEVVRSASSNQIADGGGGGSGVDGGGVGGSSVPLKSPLPPRSTPKIVAKFADMHLTGGSQVVPPFKPQVKVKPTILRKPVLPFPHPHMSPELARKIEKQAQSAEQAN